MDKKDIYEHLAKIYLDASSKHKKKAKRHKRIPKYLFLGVATFIFGLSVFLVTRPANNSSDSEIALILNPDAVKINFNFNPAKKEIYSLDLNKLNLRKFRTLGFSARKTNPNDNISLRVEFLSTFKERSEAYVKNVPCRWQNYKISLSEFKNISNWSEISNLSFIVEEWNAKEKSDIVYVDNIKLIR